MVKLLRIVIRIKFLLKNAKLLENILNVCYNEVAIIKAVEL